MVGKAKTKDLEDRLVRALADYDNLVKRSVREREETILRANQNLLEDLLPAIDNLERAEAHLNDPGLKMGMDQLRRMLELYGVKQVVAQEGDKFDSHLHEAVEMVDNNGDEETIAQVLSKGYMWNDGRVIRPARVKVCRGNLEIQTAEKDNAQKEVKKDE